ncbi:UDP-3-O-(3-hydroxymyristoyl)glucosamine N-acyltransferase [Aetokthonos hydrillicola Thurmond2011]|jgi:UDP-3-O-[3-hydroxymyristoyl] glucosamine N-acyltransferase|uniref:UDP-3-O-acylglucosamine N-acyltransferase n=1 Tax=Aetokthonos hydrillicola Thurmond2011 TaxID=2712845 RepID=A0AAP5I591_9CYAN|nr:UDP-3-O-(3-hydroxymyristoyl)glucosamine N-acyltransferase [Aetokthonos hydrillicola]MBO3457289.1 UDP-3-O-(3-hydroxymyristoyl)glucosamine N-acyltransferase [Aetokthonos hydrillicola CCALA 1050]MBW4586634.1 UDP-3-O-(3-hydroxymyristoyl)glucosamine N-acyltransferase [Aetokthonos hydrillicola CCALA 1050]MDR9894039.1 UDP-3-O-(3-hydroxymyristoyl)glucosamine N-acyltransferase [Aetokthonos hydrillicola Thurmond2011]
MKFSEILQKLGDAATCNSLSNNQDPDITGVAALDEAVTGTLSYIEGAKFASFVNKTNASALILPKEEALQAQAQERGIVWIATPEPRLLFAKVIAVFYQPWRPLGEIHPTAVIHPTAKIGKDVYIGAHVVIEENVEIGDLVCIHPNVVIYPDVKIGDRTTLHANCTIHERSRIGADCTIHSGAVIGDEGFGFVPTKNGWVKMEQSGYTVLEDNVEIGCNSAVDRPAVGETRVGYNTKIDNLVQIAHGCQIGPGCAIASQTGMAGGVKLGKGVILAGQVGIANQAKIGDRAIASAQTGIHSDVAPGEIVCGSPAMSHKTYLKVSAIINRLPEIYQSVKKLNKLLRKADTV